MRPLLLLALLLGAVALASGGVNLQTASRFEFTDCSATGSASQALTEGTYLLRVTDEDVFLCWTASCAHDGGPGGEKFPDGTVMLLTIQRGGQTLSCRSAGATGDVVLTRTSH